MDASELNIDIDGDYNDEDEENEWDKLIASFSTQNKGLKTLEITRQEGRRRRRRTDDELEELFQAISKLPQLKTLELESLSPRDLSLVQVTFANFQSLEILSIDPPERKPFMSDKVARSIASMPKLRDVSITSFRSFAISNLLSPSVETVSVEAPDDVPLKEDHFRRLVEVLNTNRFTRLKSLELNWLTVQNYQIPLLASLLKENTTLDELCLSLLISPENVDECCEAIIEALSHNKVLRSFRNLYEEDFGKHVSSATKERQNQMLLHQNTTLEKFRLFDNDDESLLNTRQKNVLLRLNKAGRKRLMVEGGGSADDWVDVIWHPEVKDDLPCLFHLLRTNPSLWLSHCQKQNNGQKRDSSHLYGH